MTNAILNTIKKAVNSVSNKAYNTIYRKGTGNLFFWDYSDPIDISKFELPILAAYRLSPENKTINWDYEGDYGTISITVQDSRYYIIDQGTKRYIKEYYCDDYWTYKITCWDGTVYQTDDDDWVEYQFDEIMIEDARAKLLKGNDGIDYGVLTSIKAFDPDAENNGYDMFTSICSSVGNIDETTVYCNLNGAVSSPYSINAGVSKSWTQYLSPKQGSTSVTEIIQVSNFYIRVITNNSVKLEILYSDGSTKELFSFTNLNSNELFAPPIMIMEQVSASKYIRGIKLTNTGSAAMYYTNPDSIFVQYLYQ